MHAPLTFEHNKEADMEPPRQTPSSATEQRPGRRHARYRACRRDRCHGTSARGAGPAFPASNAFPRAPHLSLIGELAPQAPQGGAQYLPSSVTISRQAITPACHPPGVHAAHVERRRPVAGGYESCATIPPNVRESNSWNY